jgi:peptidyl-prolyl cis-trans isomerase SurA
MTLRFAPSPRFIRYRLALYCATLVVGITVVTFQIQPAFGQSAPAASAGTTQQSPYPDTVVEQIVARVNDQVISRSDYERAEQDLEQQAAQQQWTQQQLYDQKHELLRDLIDRQLLLSRGKELAINGETDLVKRLDEMRKQYHLDSMEALQKSAEAQGVSWEDFKASIRNQIISQQVIRDEVGRHVNITQAEMQAYYDQHKQEFNQPEQVRLSEILIPTANPDDAAQLAQAKKKAEDIDAKLAAGANFAEMAKQYSGGPTAATGGDLGEFKRGGLAKVLEDQTFDLKAGQLTQPIQTKEGYIVLKVTEHNPGGIPPMKDVLPQVEDAVGMQKMNPALRDYLTKLREDAYIDIASGYEDAGRSPNEMKPVYSAYAPPSPKKKKQHVQRARFRGRGRNGAAAPTTETASAAAGVPSLADVPQGSAPATDSAAPSAGTTQSASTSSNTRKVSTKTGSMKPGKKEKIRFGQAPRETLPAAPTRTEDAGSVTGSEGEQIAANQPPPTTTAQPAVQALNPDGTAVNPDAKEAKTRFAARARIKKAKQKGPKIDPFAPPPPTKEEVASQQLQGQPLGLNGDTSKKKKSPRNEGPKRRMKDDKKDKQQPAGTDTAQPASSTTGTH